MKLNVQALSLASAVTAAILWLACYLLVLGMPGAMMGMTGQMMHADTGHMEWSMSGVGFIVGLVLWPLIAAASGWLIATFYNRFDSSN